MTKLFSVAFPALLLLLAVLMGGCLRTPEEKQALADAAILQIQLFNESGVDPINLDETELLALQSACILAPLASPENAADIVLICKPLMEAAK